MNRRAAIGGCALLVGALCLGACSFHHAHGPTARAGMVTCDEAASSDRAGSAAGFGEMQGSAGSGEWFAAARADGEVAKALPLGWYKGITSGRAPGEWVFLYMLRPKPADTARAATAAADFAAMSLPNPYAAGPGVAATNLRQATVIVGDDGDVTVQRFALETAALEGRTVDDCWADLPLTREHAIEVATAFAARDVPINWYDARCMTPEEDAAPVVGPSGEEIANPFVGHKGDFGETWRPMWVVSFILKDVDDDEAIAAAGRDFAAKGFSTNPYGGVLGGLSSVLVFIDPQTGEVKYSLPMEYWH